jgi:putative SOS response-associated peptidase YedK
MCGRFTIQYTCAEYHDALNLIPQEAAGRNDPPRYNVAPTQDVGFVCIKDSELTVLDGRWWLVPFWAKEVPKYAMFNARSETAHEKSSFRDAMKSKRCLIPADGYYEWTNAEDGGKDPHYIHLPDNMQFFFAGLWAHNNTLDITSCTILTAAADPAIKHIHDRMPIILKPSACKEWIDADRSVDEVRQTLKQERGSKLQSYRVSRAVISSKAQGPELIQPI